MQRLPPTIALHVLTQEKQEKPVISSPFSPVVWQVGDVPQRLPWFGVIDPAKVSLPRRDDGN